MTFTVATHEVVGVTEHEEIETVSDNTADYQDNPCGLNTTKALTFLGWGCSLCCCCHNFELIFSY
jgi:hypothetical protein